MMDDAMRHSFVVPIEEGSGNIRIKINCWRETDYAGTNPQMVIKRPGVADATQTDGGSSGQWNGLTYTLTPAVDDRFFILELVSNNTAISGNYKVYWTGLVIR